MMKKYIAILGMTFSVLNGQVANLPSGTLDNRAQIALPKSFIELQQTNFQNTQQLSKRGVAYSGFIEIGTSFYDLQTNYAMPHRILLNPNGSISATWTTSEDANTGFPKRGSGYNIKSAAGTWLPSSNKRVEGSTRTGWPMLMRLPDNNHFIIGHFAASGGFYRTASSTPYTTPNSNSQNILVESTIKPLWGRAANNGDTVHLICSYADSSEPGEKRAPTRKGIFSPMVYSRSLDGGLTWPVAHTMLPGYDSTITSNGGSDQYAIDVKGNIVVIANADLLQGVILWKSTDAGQTFTRIIADSFPYMPYNDKKLMLDTPFSNDGTIEVLIDNDNKINAWWGIGRAFDDDITNTTYSFFPGLQGLVYWKEGTGKGRVIASGSQFDRNGDGANNLTAETIAALENGNVPTNLSTVARLTNTSALRQPSAGIDKDGNLFVTFSVPIESDLSEFNANYRDIAIVHSTNKGTTWGASQNITQLVGWEDDFASVAREVNDFVHVTWQNDKFCGNNLSNNSTNSENHPAVSNRIFYQAVPVSEILAGNIGQTFGLKVQNPNTGAVKIVTQPSPNPTNNLTSVTLWLSQPGTITCELHNLSGQLVKTIHSSNLVRGNHVLEIPMADLANGLYTYSILSAGSIVSGKVVKN